MSWKIARLAGIDVFLHWTFFLLLGWILWSYLSAGASLAAAGMGVVFVVTLFGCIVLHELGHALAARYFGVPTRNITIYPIGGVASLARIPERPLQEFVIAIAGPLVNVAIAAVLIAIMFAMSASGNLLFRPILSGSFLTDLLWANIVLVIFNLIPAFPMDGGRMLRAGLAALMPYSTATRAATTVGQVLAVLFAIAGLFIVHNTMLVFIAGFIFLAAGGEARMAGVRDQIQKMTVGQVMQTRFQILSPQDSLLHAEAFLARQPATDFPVLENGQLVGMVFREDLTSNVGSKEQQTIAELMRSEFPVLVESSPLKETLSTMQDLDCPSAPVVRAGQLIGLLEADRVHQMLLSSRPTQIQPIGKSTLPGQTSPSETYTPWQRTS